MLIIYLVENVSKNVFMLHINYKCIFCCKVILEDFYVLKKKVFFLYVYKIKKL